MKEGGGIASIGGIGRQKRRGTGIARRKEEEQQEGRGVAGRKKR